MKAEIFNKLTNKSGHIIGFANVMYTLYQYDVREMVDYLGNLTGETYCICTFIKNISSDLNKVRELYPNLEIDKTLHGHTSVFSYSSTGIEEPRETPVHEIKFSFGKYKGEIISECKDVNYICWAANANASNREEERAALKFYAIELGCKEFMGCLVTPEYMEGDEFKMRLAFNETLSKNEPFEFEATRNLDSIGYTTVNFIGMSFENYKEMGSSYYGMYALPTINGKAKKIKGKKLLITNYTYNGYTITVKEWEFA